MKAVIGLLSVGLLLGAVVQISESRGNGGSKSSSKPEQRSGHPIYQFASRIINQVAEERGPQQNILISPFSIRTALAIVYLGAKGKTSEEIRKSLQLPEEREELIQNLANQISTTSISSSSELKIGNGLFLEKSRLLNETLVKSLKDRLKVNVQKLDFKENPSGSSSQINSWISQITKGYIQDLVSPSSISSKTSFLLANALFYSGQWEKPFTVLPQKGTFKIDSRTEVKVNMMGAESTFGYSYIPELKSTAISLPFKDDRFEFVILKPDEEQTIDSVRPLLLNYNLDQLANKLSGSPRTVTLTLPKFTLRANYDTITTLRKMGIVSLFDARTCDISRLTKSPTQEKTSVSKMVHQTLLDINELGATGAAGTAISGYPISSSSNLDIDKPFLFLLNDRLTGPLLIGQMVNPTQ